MKYILPVLTGLCMSTMLLANDTLIYNSSVTLNSSLSQYDNVDVVADGAVSLNSGFTFSSNGNGAFNASSVEYELERPPVSYFNPQASGDSSDILGSPIVGAIQGQPGVSSFGGATYSIPIGMPKGNKNMIPSLSIGYNSQAGKGLLGVGWNLGGLSSIAASGKKQYYDQDYSIVSSTVSENRLYWDGQRLKGLNGYGLTSDSFCTENFSKHKIERFGTGNSMWFRIKTMDGRTMEYGNSTDSRLALDANTQWIWMLTKVYDRYGNTIKYTYTTDSSTGKILLSKIEYGGSSSSFVNEINLHYTSNSEISYSYIHDDIILKDQLLDSISIKSNGHYWGSYGFRYDDDLGEMLLESVHQYDKDNNSLNPTVISWEAPTFNINGSVGSVNVQDGSSFRYFTGDFTGDGYDDLLSVNVDLAGDNVEYYLYKGSSTGLSSTVDESGDLPTSYTRELWGDLGDEFDTKCGGGSVDPASTVYGQADVTNIFSGDFDGDGVDELYVKTLEWDLFAAEFPSDLSTIDTAFVSSFINDTECTSISVDLISPHLATLDYGIGKLIHFDELSSSDERVIAYRLGDEQIYEVGDYRLPDMKGYGYSFFPDAGKIKYLDLELDSMVTFCNISGDQMWAELNGDGITDYMEDDTTEFDIWLYNSTTNSFDSIDTSFDQIIGTVDLNGDGISAWVAVSDEQFIEKTLYQIWLDLKYDDSDITTGTLFVDFLDIYEDPSNDFDDYWRTPPGCNPESLSCRKGYLQSTTGDWSIGQELYLDHYSGHGPKISFGFTPGSESPYKKAVAVDIDADGKNDLLLFDDDGVETIYYDFTPTYNSGQINYTYSTNSPSFSLGSNVKTGDFNGDGITEFIDPTIDSLNTLCFISSGKPRKHINKITNGMGSIIEYDFSPMTDSDVYTKSEDATYPIMDYIAPRYVLASLTMNNGIASDNEVEYSYEGAKIHLQGKGFLGFEKRETENTLQNAKQIVTTSFDTTYFQPNRLMSKQYLGGQQTEENTQDLNLVSKGGYIYSVELDSTIAKNLITNTTTISTFAYNSDGLINEKETDFGSNISVKENYSYTAAGWHVAALPKNISRTWDRSGSSVSDSSHMTYNSGTGALLQKKLFAGTDRELTSTFHSFDDYGNPQGSAVLGKRGKTLSTDSITSSMTYSSDGRYLLSSEAPLDFKSTYSINLSTGTLNSQKGANRLQTDFEYGAFNRLKTKILPDDLEQSSYLVWAVDHPDAPSGALYYSWSGTSGSSPVMVFFDGAGRELRVVSRGYGDEVIYTDMQYDSRGRISKKSLPYFPDDVAIWSTYTYDSLSRVKTFVTPDYETTAYCYIGLQTEVTVSKGSTSSKSTTLKNVLGETISSTDNKGNTVNFVYYPDGKLKETFEGEHSSKKQTYSYDVQGNRTSLDDPDLGTINSSYDAFGQLLLEINGKGDTTTFTYDKAGRLISKTDDRGTINYSFISDTTKDSFGQPDSIYNEDKSQLELFTYESEFGRLSSHSSAANGKTFTNSYTYDWYGRLLERTYPSGFETSYSYTSGGHLKKVYADGNPVWSCSDVNSLGLVTGYSQGSYSTTLSYATTGRLSQKTTGSVLNWKIWYDDLGNIDYREDLITNQKETFAYDSLNRLTSVDYYLDGVLDNSAGLDISYDRCGNITSHSNVSANINYGEGTAGPHALTSIKDPYSSYIPSKQKISYTSFNKVSNISDTLSDSTILTLDITYGLNNQRTKTIKKTDGTIQRVRYYAGDYEEDSTSAGVIKYHFINGGNGLTAIFVKQGSGEDTLHYVLQDHLGSIVGLINAETNEVKKYSFDVWGNPRSASDWKSDFTGSLFADRGFTGHEHLTDFNLINMNGRVYDPVIARFLSPDPIISIPGYANSYNRYSYVLNNPLKYTDPSGYRLEGEDLREQHYLQGNPPGEGWTGWSWLNQTGGGPQGIGSTWYKTRVNYHSSARLLLASQNGGYWNTSMDSPHYFSAWDVAKFGDAASDLQGQTANITKSSGRSWNRPMVQARGFENHFFQYDRTTKTFYAPWTDIVVDPLAIFAMEIAGSLAAVAGGAYYQDPMFYINGGIGVASTGATIKGGYYVSNELYHYTRSSGNLHFKGGRYWNNPFVNNSKAAIAARGGMWRSMGTKLGYAGIAVTTGDAFLSGEFSASQGINVFMTGLAIGFPGVGSAIAGLYFVADFGLTLSTGRGIGDRIDATTGGTHELYKGLY